MRWNGWVMERLSDNNMFAENEVPILPVVELAGDRRVLIEGHAGVVQYLSHCIGVRVRFGQLQICGCDLHLVHMTKERLVICGRIDGITLQRGECG